MNQIEVVYFKNRQNLYKPEKTHITVYIAFSTSARPTNRPPTAVAPPASVSGKGGPEEQV